MVGVRVRAARRTPWQRLGLGEIIPPTGLPAHSCLCVLCLQLVDFWCPLGPPVRVAAFCSVIDRVAAALNALLRRAWLIQAAAASTPTEIPTAT